MKTTNLGEADGLPTIEWSQVETQLADLLTHDDPHSPNRSTFWLTTLNADGSPHTTSVGALWRHCVECGETFSPSRRATTYCSSRANSAGVGAPPNRQGRAAVRTRHRRRPV